MKDKTAVNVLTKLVSHLTTIQWETDAIKEDIKPADVAAENIDNEAQAAVEYAESILKLLEEKHEG